MPALDGFTLNAQLLISGTAVATGEGSGTGTKIPDTRKAINFALTSVLGKTIANNAAGGADQFYGEIVDVAAGGTATVDLQSFIDYLGRTGGTLARAKNFLFCLLPTAQGGTAASQVTIGNGGTNGNALFTGAKTHTLVLTNGRVVYCGDVSAAGITVNSTNKDVLITNNDGAVAAKVLVAIAGGST